MNGHTMSYCKNWVCQMSLQDGSMFIDTKTKMCSCQISSECLERFKKNSLDFLRKYVAVVKTMIYSYPPKMKEQSKSVTSADKVMMLVVCDSKG